MKKYARVLDFLQSHHEDVYKVIDDLGMQGALKPFRERGITFLLPDAKSLKKLQAIVVSDKPEPATDFVDVLILTDYYGSPQDFLKAKGTIANRAGKQLLVKSVNGNKVVVEGDEGDAELVATDFKGFDRVGKSVREKMAVWQLKGMPKLETPAAPSRKPLKKGGAPEAASSDAAAKVAEWRQAVLAKKLKWLAEARHSQEDGKRECPMLFAVCQVLHVWESQQKDNMQSRECYYKARGLLTHHPCIDFFLLFFNPQVFPAEQLVFAKEAAELVDKPASYLAEFCDADVPLKEEVALNKELGLAEEPCLALRSAGLKQLQEAREQQVERIASNHTTALAEILKAYAELEQKNKVGDAHPALPAVLVRCYKEHPGLALLLDEAVWWLDTQFRACAAVSPDQQAAHCAALFGNWALVYGDLSFAKEKSLVLNSERYGRLLEPREFVQQCLLAFIKAYLVRVPCSSSLPRAGGDDEEDEDAESPDSAAALNVGASHVAQLSAYTDSSAQVSGGAIRQLRGYMRKHGGHMPAELR